jgi:hypothetical protein
MQVHKDNHRLVQAINALSYGKKPQARLPVDNSRFIFYQPTCAGRFNTCGLGFIAL